MAVNKNGNIYLRDKSGKVYIVRPDQKAEAAFAQCLANPVDSNDDAGSSELLQ
jgi:hypothetical protein